MADSLDSELILLEQIYKTQGDSKRILSQRDIAQASGLSLGMTNALIKRFAEKGWVSARRINSRNLHYLITPEGVNEIARRTYRYFARTARNASFYKERLEELVMRKKREGMTRLVLAGASELDFILDYLCERHGVTFVRGAELSIADRLRGEGTLVLYAESVPDAGMNSEGLSLRKIAAGLA